ncbi:ABC transporter permease subunit [Mesomycoplasma ovipneumoniae]|uniref:ABC transporter permease subunit n=1 Tax=Mesomycoplasma ovipneumoniae TaxID=29562 RepID=UPI002964E7FA|nr:ABC transporter permease subunit [Mesomycoplasma ovipneumoniae]MDW2919517.1 ABC transporter permease subunit [Mesomycoplasma ovipneumoniae]
MKMTIISAFKNKPYQRFKKTKLFFTFVFLVLFIVSFYSIFSEINYNGWNLFKKNLTDLFAFSNKHPYYSDSVFSLSMRFLWITIKYTFLGTFIGATLAFFSALFSSQFIKNKYLKSIIWWIIIILKSFPIPFIIDPLQLIFAPKLAAILIVTWFSWIWLHRYFYSFLNSLDLSGYQKAIIKGKNRFFAFKNEILPFVINKFIGLFLFSFEANIRWTTIISATGVIGIGILINDGVQNPALGWKIVGIPLAVLLVFATFLEFLIIFFNKFILHKRSVNVNQKNKYILWLKVNYNWILRIFFGFLILTLFIISILDIESWKVNQHQINRFFGSLFVIDWSVFLQGKLDNPIYMVWNLLAQVIVCLAIIAVVSILWLLAANEKLNHWIKWSFFKFLLNFFRIIPSIVIFYLFLSFAVQPILWVTFLVGIKNGLGMAKKLNETLNSIDWQKYKLLRLRQWSKFKTITHYIFPLIYKEYFKYLSVQISDSIHDLLLYGIFGGSLLGQKLSSLSQTGIAGDRTAFFTFSWVTWFLILSIEIVIISIQNNYFKKILAIMVKLKNMIFNVGAKKYLL